MTPEEVQARATHRWRWNKWAVEEGKRVRKMQQKLFAASFQRRAQPMWRLMGTLAEFGDKFLGAVGLSGGSFYNAAQLYENVFKK